MTHVHDDKGQRLQMLVLERVDESLNMARFYVLALEPTLFGDAGLVREWGRSGCSGRRHLEFHGDDGKAREALESWLARKRRRGYEITLRICSGAQAEDYKHAGVSSGDTSLSCD
jgi:predicted DNA-binding WGR domain protein